MNVPKLRFKEFNDEYAKLKYKDVLKIKSGKDQKQVEDENGKYPILGTGGQIGKTNSFLYDKPSVLIGRKGTINKPQYMESPFWTVDTLFYSHIYEPNIPKYLFYSFQNVNWKKYDESTGVPSLSSSTIESVECSIPSPNEQIKVANFLSLLDKKIELQSKKIEDLKLFKLYIRKKIFSSNTNNNIRLKEIVNCEFSNITLADIENDNGIYPVYGATGFIKNIKNYNFDSEYIAIVKDGAGVGRTMICPKNSSILATMNALTIKNNYPLNYICEMINTISFDKYIVGSGIPHIYFKDYGNEEFMLHNENDANKFDSVFKCLDRKIELLNVSLDKLNILKKGLMQGMFV